jgi:hypothetical protein
VHCFPSSIRQIRISVAMALHLPNSMASPLDTPFDNGLLSHSNCQANVCSANQNEAAQAVNSPITDRPNPSGARNRTPIHCRKQSCGDTMEQEVRHCPGWSRGKGCGRLPPARTYRQRAGPATRARLVFKSIFISVLRKFFQPLNQAKLRLTVVLTVNSRCQLNSWLPRLIPTLRNALSHLIVGPPGSGRAQGRCAEGVH